MRLSILKIGGSLITHKEVEEPNPDHDAMERIAGEIARGWDPEERLILVHGAGSYGHPIVKRTGIDKGIKTGGQVVAFGECQRRQNVLSAIVCHYLIQAGVPAIPVQASALAVMNYGKLESMYAEVVEYLTEVEADEKRLVPVLGGVPAYDTEQVCSILSGDDILPYLAEELEAHRTIHATDVDGVFSRDPNTDKNAMLIPVIDKGNFEDIFENVGGSSHTDVTGGMYKKVKELIDLGIPSEIINGKNPGYIERALKGETGLGTIVKP